MMKRKFIVLGLVLLMLTAFVGCGSSSDDTTAASEDNTDSKQVSSINLSFDDEGYAQVDEDISQYDLYINEDGSSIRIEDTTTGYVWDTQASSEDFDMDSVNEKWQKQLESPFILYYTDLEEGYGAVIYLALLEMDFSVEMYAIDNGVRVVYDMENPEIVVAIDYMVDDNGFVVEIPESEIQENGKYSVTSIKLLPYFADATDTVDGYYFYPDGSGAIMEFTDSSHYKESEVSFTVYGDLTNYKNTLDVTDEGDTEVLLPVFGANLDEAGFLAIIEQGAETASIRVNPSNSVVTINSIYVSFTFRRSFADSRSSDSTTYLTFDDEMITGTRRISYRFLGEGDTTYSDMAKCYRDYLINEEGAEQLASDDSNVPVSLDLFMGIKEEGMIFDTFQTVTTFAQAEEILEELADLGVDSIELQLKGWTKNGYYTDPKMFPVNSKVGGSSGLKSLVSYAEDKDVSIILEANFLEARSSSSGFSERNDVVYLGNNSIFANYDESLFLMTPTAAQSNLTTFLDKAENYDVDGVSFYAMGQYLFYNYNSSYYTTQAQCLTIWQEMMQTASDSLGEVVVQGGNSYVIGYADKITDVPDEDSGYQITTSAVPFYQIVTHGLATYTGEAGNLSSDLEQTTLKWVEYGYMPYFELTYDGSEALMYTDYSTLFSSEYTDWIDDIAEIYADFNENLKDLQTVFIDSHEEVEDNVYKVTYENGTIIYVNYNDEDVSVDGLTVEAMSYTID